MQDPTKSSNPSPVQQSGYEEYQDQFPQQLNIPHKTAQSQAIFQKYQQSGLMFGTVIREEDQDDPDSPLHDTHKKKFTITNLDTGEKIQITNEDEENEYGQKISMGMSELDSGATGAAWQIFWDSIQLNNRVLRQYCEQGMYEEAQKMILNGDGGYPVEIDWRDSDDWSPLHATSYEGHADIVELLCTHRANVNALTKFKRNALHIAALRGYLQVAETLLKFNIDLNATDSEGNTPLHFASQNHSKELTEFLLDKGCKIIRNKQGMTPMKVANTEGIVKIFFDRGMRENDQGESCEQGKRTYNRVVENRIGPCEGIGVNDFTFHKLLGKGSFGEVYLVSGKGTYSGQLFALKVLNKEKILNSNMKRYAFTERNVMSVFNHPFMVKLNFAFQSSSKLFLVMDYCPGGDMGKLMSRRNSIPEAEAKKYICELILAFEALHKNMVVFRDLKPQNVVLDSDGHCRLTDFGLAKQGIYNNRTVSFCGSVAYLAPQILMKQGHTRTVDWYLLGLLFYELVVGMPPYYHQDKDLLFENIKKAPLKIPKNMSNQAKDLIKKLLCRDPRRRLGAERDSEELKEHPFFSGVNWQDVLSKKVPMPPVPIPKFNPKETVKVYFDTKSQGRKIEGWTFING